MKRIITLALVICAVAMTARGQTISGGTGNDILVICETSDDAGRQFCLGYMTGFRDGVAVEHTDFAKSICISSVPSEQIRDVVLRALKETPETRHEQAYGLVAVALAKAWPCP